MARIEWDALGKRFLELGLDHGVLYRQAADGTYPKGVPWNGLTEVNETPGGATPNDLYADNIKYASIRSAETWSATISAYTYPDEFNECNGSKETADGVYVGQQERAGFGFVYRTLVKNDTATTSDDGYVLHLCYGLTASPSEMSSTTMNDSPNAVNPSWEVTSIPVASGWSSIKPTSTIRINSLYCDREKLKELEDVLYGTETVEARLPLPYEVMDIMGYTGPQVTVQKMAIDSMDFVDY